LAGYASTIGYTYDSIAGAQASGETAEFNYTCLGDETSFTLTQYGMNSSSSYTGVTVGALRLTINGGVNDGKMSPSAADRPMPPTAMPQPHQRSNLSTLVAPTKYGAYRNAAKISLMQLTMVRILIRPMGKSSAVTYSLGLNSLTVYYGATWTNSGYVSAGGLVYNGTRYGVGKYD